MEDRYLVIYERYGSPMRRDLIHKDDLCYWVNKIINEYKGVIISITKCFVSV